MIETDVDEFFQALAGKSDAGSNQVCVETCVMGSGHQVVQLSARHRTAPEFSVPCPEPGWRLPEIAQPALLRGRPNGIRGRVWACSNPEARPRSLLNPERTGRWPSRLHICKVQGIELCPKNIALIAERLDRSLLLLAGFSVLIDIIDREARVFWSLGQPRFEIIQTADKPRVVLTKFVHAQCDQIA